MQIKVVERSQQINVQEQVRNVSFFWNCVSFVDTAKQKDVSVISSSSVTLTVCPGVQVIRYKLSFDKMHKVTCHV